MQSDCWHADCGRDHRGGRGAVHAGHTGVPADQAHGLLLIPIPREQRRVPGSAGEVGLEGAALEVRLVGPGVRTVRVI